MGRALQDRVASRSKYLQQSALVSQSPATVLTDRKLTFEGWNTITDVIPDNKFIKKVFIVTSSDVVINDIENLFRWT